MENPWRKVDLADYERHMSLSSVFQSQTLDAMMERQLYDWPVSSVCILGVAGGNGLRHVDPEKLEKVYGVDINPDYLDACRNRYPGLAGCFRPVLADLTRQEADLPRVDLVIADLFIEYVGYGAFVRAVLRMRPSRVSCIVQVDAGTEFVSRSPYLEKLSVLEAVHRTIDADTLTERMARAGYRLCKTESEELPNGKRLHRVDYAAECRDDRVL